MPLHATAKPPLLKGPDLPSTDPYPTLSEMDRRIRFHDKLQAMEVDFSGFRFADSATVNRFYDRIEERVRETGESQWFFLINYSESRIEPEAWFSYSRRGKELNLAFTMGTVRFDVSDITRRQIERDAETERFDPNLFADRDSALARIRQMPTKRRKRFVQHPTHTAQDIRSRVSFDPETVIMEANFSDFAFHHSRDVDDFYDHLEERIKETDRKWFFLVNLNRCEIMPAAWVRYAHRGKMLNIAASLGSVRFAAGSETEADIRMRAESQDFRPNIRNTRAEALERVEELRAELLQGKTP